MISADQVASLIVIGVGSLLFWANPKRKVNRAVFASSMAVAAWLACNHFAASKSDGLIWLRWIYATGAIVPLSLWMVKESIVGTFRFRDRRRFCENISWLVFAALLCALPFTEFFIPSDSSDEARLRGVGFPLYYVGIISLYARLLCDAFKNLKSISGARKLELQVWLCGGCAVATLIYGLIALSDLTGDSLFRKLKPVAVLIFYAGTAYAITSHRIFDARQMLLVGLEKVSLIAIAVVLAYSVGGLANMLMPQTPTLLFTAAIVVSVAGPVSSWLDRKFQFTPKSGEARQAAFATAQRETRPDRIESSFRALLKGWGQTERAIILSGTKGNLVGSGMEFDANGVLVCGLRSLRWVTPERLVRERLTVERQVLADFLETHELGVLIFEEGPTLSVAVGVGIGASRRPYTYPQVNQLMELGSIIQSAFERAHYSSKAQQAEQLATVGLLGASVAHEIRNPLVSIKTFVQLLPSHYSDKQFRDKFFKLIGDEVSRIDQLTEQLLDLAAPRAYAAQIIELHPLLISALELVAAKAAHKHVELRTDFKAQPDRAFTDSSAAKQVVLNLCFNAIQAVETHPANERWVKVATRNTPAGIEMVVADSGPGIAPEIVPRLFQPFQTTKSSGFGLGLAVCSDILAHVQASIIVDPPRPGCGATFRVTFPCRPSSS